MEEYIGPLLTIFDCLTLGVGVTAAGGVGAGVIVVGASIFVQDSTNKNPKAKINFFINVDFNLSFGVIEFIKYSIKLYHNSSISSSKSSADSPSAPLPMALNSHPPFCLDSLHIITAV